MTRPLNDLRTPRPPQPPQTAAPQPSRIITLHLTAEQATALENMRINETTRTSPPVPVHADLAEMIDHNMRKVGGLLYGAMSRYPSAAVVAAQLTAAKASQSSAAAQAAIASQAQSDLQASTPPTVTL